jgi:hypothetical protein
MGPGRFSGHFVSCRRRNIHIDIIVIINIQVTRDEQREKKPSKEYLVPSVAGNQREQSTERSSTSSSVRSKGSKCSTKSTISSSSKRSKKRSRTQLIQLSRLALVAMGNNLLRLANLGSAYDGMARKEIFMLVLLSPPCWFQCLRQESTMAFEM